MKLAKYLMLGWEKGAAAPLQGRPPEEAREPRSPSNVHFSLLS